MNREILYGTHPVLEALMAGRRKFHGIYLAKASASTILKRIESLAHQKRLRLTKVSPAEIGHRAGSPRHQGVCAEVTGYAMGELDELLDSESLAPENRMLILLDSIMDPHNLGAVIRTALGAGAGGIIIPKDRAAGPTPAVSKASAGALEHACLVRVTNVTSTLNLLKKGGWWIYGLEREGRQTIYQTDFPQATALVVGGEGKGIRPLVKAHCDALINIPQLGPVTSLNASVAAALAMYEVFRRKQHGLQ